MLNPQPVRALPVADCVIGSEHFHIAAPTEPRLAESCLPVRAGVHGHPVAAMSIRAEEGVTQPPTWVDCQSGRICRALGIGISGEHAATPDLVFQVEGQRQVTVNGEKQILSVKGVVRPLDIAPNNTIFSTNLANAEITYKGDGIVSRQQKPGLISRILDFIWIF